jgi:bifunctional non-homologous end joining protein LigD
MTSAGYLSPYARRTSPSCSRDLSGIFLSDFEQWEIGPPRLQLGLEGLVSKHRQRAYRAGRAEHWGKVKNPAHPAFVR